MKYTGEWRDYVTRQARWVDFDHDYRTYEPRLHGVGDVGVQAALRQGPRLRGLPGAAVLLERRDAAVQPRAADGRRRLPEAAGPGGHRRARGSPRATVRGVKLLVWTTTPWTLPSNLRSWSARTSSTSSWSPTSPARRALRDRRGAAGRVRPRARRRRRTSSGASPAPTWSAGLHAAVHLLRRPRATRSGWWRPSSSPPPTAPGWCTPPARSVRTTRSSPTARASRRSCRSARTGGSPTRSTSTRACTSSTPTCRSSTTSRPPPAASRPAR